jgi:hypothetical protein
VEGWPDQDFLAHLRRLDLLDDRPGESSLIADRRRFLDESLSTVPPGPRLPVLLVGLGGLGLAVLRDLLGARRFTVSLFDPAPIQAADVGPFYRPAEIGQDKAHVLWTCLAPRTRGFVRRIEAGRSPHRPVEATLAPIVDAVRAAVCSDQSPGIALAVASARRSARVPLLAADTTEVGAATVRLSGLNPRPPAAVSSARVTTVPSEIPRGGSGPISGETPRLARAGATRMMCRCRPRSSSCWP